jgi:hypothetical protein
MASFRGPRGVRQQVHLAWVLSVVVRLAMQGWQPLVPVARRLAVLHHSRVLGHTVATEQVAMVAVGVALARAMEVVRAMVVVVGVVVKGAMAAMVLSTMLATTLVTSRAATKQASCHCGSSSMSSHRVHEQTGCGEQQGGLAAGVC